MAVAGLFISGSLALRDFYGISRIPNEYFLDLLCAVSNLERRVGARILWSFLL
jgi:hypothetical protein